MAGRVDFAIERVREILRINQDTVSLEQPMGDEDDFSLSDLIEDREAVVPADAAARSMLNEAVQRGAGPAVAEREQEVVRLRFGLDDGQMRTLEEVGKEFGVTRERIRQIESKTLAKLRHPSRPSCCGTTSTRPELTEAVPPAGPGSSASRSGRLRRSAELRRSGSRRRLLRAVARSSARSRAMASAAWSPFRQPNRTPMVSFIRSTPRVATALDLSATRVAVPATGAEPPQLARPPAPSGGSARDRPVLPST